MRRRSIRQAVAGVSVAMAILLAWPALAQSEKPNILVIWGDDIGTWNISHNNRGMMGYETPNIDRIAAEGLSFTDYYAQQSCTAGRAAFIGGNVPVRTGMTKVGLPGAEQGWQEQDDVTIAARCSRSRVTPPGSSARTISRRPGRALAHQPRLR